MSDPLSNLYLLVVQECNLACSYCYAAGGHFGQPAQQMSAPVMRRALERLLPRVREHLTLSFFGGEPLLNVPLLRETVDYTTRLAALAGKHVSFSLSTNAVLLDDEALDFLGAHVASLAISLDGDRAANEGRVFRDGRATFDAVVQGVTKLRERGIAFALRGTITPENVDQLLETADFLGGLGAASVRVVPAEGLEWTADSYRRLVESTVELNRRGVRLMLEGRAPPGCDHAYRIVAHRAANFAVTQPCLAGGGVLAVAADGTVYPCEHFVGVARFAMGHVYDEEFPGEQFARIERLFAGCTVDARPGCARCLARTTCGGQCYAEAYGVTGDIARPDPRHCALVRKVYSQLDPEVTALLGDAESARSLRTAIVGR